MKKLRNNTQISYKMALTWLPNKKANTLSMDYYYQIRQAAEASRRKFLYDTNGCWFASIENLQNLLNAGDELVQFNGILQARYLTFLVN